MQKAFVIMRNDESRANSVQFLVGFCDFDHFFAHLCAIWRWMLLSIRGRACQPHRGHPPHSPDNIRIHRDKGEGRLGRNHRKTMLDRMRFGRIIDDTRE